MPNIELDLATIYTQGRKKEKENLRFRQFLKSRRSIVGVDEIAHRITAEVSSEIDCTKCGNCCKELMPGMNETEIEKIANHLEMNRETFVQSFLQFSADDQAFFTRHSPCAFLDNNMCTIYAHRPQSCHDFPNLHKKDFAHRMLSVIDNYPICPIVYNVVEQMKKEMGFE